MEQNYSFLKISLTQKNHSFSTDWFFSVFHTVLCGENSVCENLDGSYECLCDTGFEVDSRPSMLGLQSNLTNCIDKNECHIAVNQTSPCYQLCANNIGSFECSCFNGFALMEDGKTCTQIDLCLADNGGCSHQCGFQPESVDSKELVVRCSCPMTHVLLSDEKTCDFANDAFANDLDDTVYGNYESALDYGDQFNTDFNADDFGIYDWVDQSPGNAFSDPSTLVGVDSADSELSLPGTKRLPKSLPEIKIHCKPGEFGKTCQFRCASDCVYGKCVNIKQSSTVCRCKPGHTGFFCRRKCPIGTYGRYCLKKCTNDCKNGSKSGA